MISKFVICAVVCFILGVITGLSHESSDRNTKTQSSANTPNAS